MHKHVQRCPKHPARSMPTWEPLKFDEDGTPVYSYYLRDGVILKRTLQDRAADRLRIQLRELAEERFQQACSARHPAFSLSLPSLPKAFPLLVQRML